MRNKNLRLKFHLDPTNCLAVHVELLSSIQLPNTPMLLNTVILLGWLPCLIESLEHKDVDTPLQHGADSLLPILSLVLDGSWGTILEGLTLGWPSSLTNPELKRLITLNLLHTVNSLHDIVIVTLGGIVHLLSLPVREGVGKDNVGAGNGGFGISFDPLVPGVGGTDGDLLTAGNSANDLADFGDGGGQLVALQLLAIHVLGADGDTNDVVEAVLGEIAIHC
jgi:hypothetical protein